MRQPFLWAALGLGTVVWMGGQILPGERQVAPLLHGFGGSSQIGVASGTSLALLKDFAYPVAVIAGSEGLWVVDHNNNRILFATPTDVQSLAGNGEAEASGDGGSATQAGLFPLGIARDQAGNLFIADHLNHRVRKVSPQGQISTVAGNGRAGFAGDGGQATVAELNDPTGVAVDRAGTLFIADQDNNRVRQVQAGLITTLNTGGDPPLKTPWSLAFDCQNRLLIVDLGHDLIRRWDGKRLMTVAGTGKTGFSGDGGPATSAQLNSPAGLAVSCQGEQEEIFIADSGNDRVRKVDAQGRISTVAGNGTFGLAGDGGPAQQAQLGSPYGVSLDTQGNLYIADANNNRIRRVKPSGRIETVLSPEGLNP